MNSETSINTKQYFPDSSFNLPTISFNKTYNAGSSAIQELDDFMNSFITKHAPKKKDKKNKRQHNNENETPQIIVL
ncbi:6964_t:CDS:2, partial [Gigaspora margarita]